jgi:hypothetical protein
MSDEEAGAIRWSTLLHSPGCRTFGGRKLGHVIPVPVVRYVDRRRVCVGAITERQAWIHEGA